MKKNYAHIILLGSMLTNILHASDKKSTNGDKEREVIITKLTTYEHDIKTGIIKISDDNKNRILQTINECLTAFNEEKNSEVKK